MRIAMLAIVVAALACTFAAARPFPSNFAWGTATAAYQVEGAWNVSGRGLSIWDVFCTYPGRIANGQNGDVADDFYHRYHEDIKIMKDLGIKNFRLSISWSRVLPNGTPDKPNQAGVKFYNDLFDALLNAGITPWVTLYHWDLPQAFNKNSNVSTWLDPNIPIYFRDYADFCFKSFGDKVKHWLTFNEPGTFTWLGYGVGIHAPGRCSPDWGDWCQQVGGGGNTSTEPYIAAKNLLVAHALAVKVFREKYQRRQKGLIGMTVSTEWAVPYNTTVAEDWEAVNIYIEFEYGLYNDPVIYGNYPESMQLLITGNRLIPFNNTEKLWLKGSVDFLGLNQYTSRYVKWTGVPGTNMGDDNRIQAGEYNASGHLIGPEAESTWENVYPPGIRELAKWIRNRYPGYPIYVFENGVSDPGESQEPLPAVLNDTYRVNFYRNYIGNLTQAIVEDDVDVRGYFAWSLLDNFEWTDGYNVRFGMVYVDYANNLTRYIKESAYWYSNHIKQSAQGTYAIDFSSEAKDEFLIE